MESIIINKIGVLCFYEFPEGMAPTTRILAYGKGLVNNGVETEVVIFRPRKVQSNTPETGYVEGVKYVYTHSRNIYISRLRNLFYEKPLSVLKTIRYIKQSNQDKKYDFMLLSFDNIPHMIIYVIALKLLKIPMLFIGDEFPIPIREQLKEDIPSWKKIAYRIIHKPFVGRILMTDALKQYYNKITKPKPTHILPTIVDIDRFINLNNNYNTDGAPYLCYMGNMELSKDNVDNIIRAFYYLKSRKGYDSLELHLYGTPSVKDKTFLETVIQELGLEKSVLFMGRANYSEVPIILSKAEVLVTSQPKTKRAEGGFPTKLGEYLLSLRPAIVTDVGEIHNYITDGVNAYMVSPEDPLGYADKLDYIFNNIIEAEQVAERGKNYIIENFSCENVAANMLRFMTVLKKQLTRV